MHILSTNQFKKDEVEKLLSRASEMEKSLRDSNTSKLLSGKIIACIFLSLQPVHACLLKLQHYDWVQI